MSEIETPTGKELIEIEALNAVDIFEAEGGVNSIIARMQALIKNAPRDMTTQRGRDEIKSFAYKISLSKTALDGLGKAHVEGVKKKVAEIDAGRKLLRDTFDNMKDAYRKPLTDFETAEKTRVENHNKTIEKMRDMAILPFEATTADIEARIEELVALEERDFQEFQPQAETVREVTMNKLSERLAAQIKSEKEAAELAQLRAEAEARRMQDEEAERQKQADERARAAADAEIQKAKDDAARQVQEAQEAAQRAIEAAAAPAEGQLIPREQPEPAATIPLRRLPPSERAHKAKINGAILQELQNYGIDEDQAKKIIAAIACGKIPHVSITY